MAVKPIQQKIEELFEKLQLSEEDKAYLYIVMTEYVGKEMEIIIKRILTDVDLKKLELMSRQEDADVYIAQRFKEETGKPIQTASDEILVSYIENIQIQGIKELLRQRSRD